MDLDITKSAFLLNFYFRKCIIVVLENIHNKVDIFYWLCHSINLYATWYFWTSSYPILNSWLCLLLNGKMKNRKFHRWITKFNKILLFVSYLSQFLTQLSLYYEEKSFSKICHESSSITTSSKFLNIVSVVSIYQTLFIINLSYHRVY